jgi:hypothetical protein
MSDDLALFDLPTAEIEASLAAAWQQAAPPFAPLQRGSRVITWSPIEAMVAHVPAR